MPTTVGAAGSGRHGGAVRLRSAAGRGSAAPAARRPDREAPTRLQFARLERARPRTSVPTLIPQAPRRGGPGIPPGARTIGRLPARRSSRVSPPADRARATAAADCGARVGWSEDPGSRAPGLGDRERPGGRGWPARRRSGGTRRRRVPSFVGANATSVSVTDVVLVVPAVPAVPSRSRSPAGPQLAAGDDPTLARRASPGGGPGGARRPGPGRGPGSSTGRAARTPRGGSRGRAPRAACPRIRRDGRTGSRAGGRASGGGTGRS